MDTTFHVDYLRKERLAVYRPSGPLTDQCVERIFCFLLGAEGAAPGPFDRFVDLTRVTEFPQESSVIHAYARIRTEAVAHLPPCRTAIVAPNIDAEIVARLYATLMHDTPISVEVFSNTQAAAAWLGVAEPVLEPQSAYRP